MQESRVEAFRKLVRRWLADHYPPELRDGPEQPPVWGGSRQRYPNPAARRWLEAMAEQGWTVPTWPVEYGGAGLSHTEAMAIRDELRVADMRPPLVMQNQSITMLGPILLEYGSEEQRRRFLPQIARGEVRWCQGYSEPEAGSDLANIQTRGIRKGDVYVTTGHKIWSSYAHLSDWMFALVRTEPEASKHGGISFLLIDLNDPGITVEPITLLSGESDFCEVFLDEVHVPVDQLVGEPGQGWAIAKRLLEHERAMLGSAGGALAGGGTRRKSLPDQAADLVGLTAGRLRDPIARYRLARHLADVTALKSLTRLASDEQRRDAHLASLLKLVSTEIHMDRQDLLADMAGLLSAARSGDAFGEEDLQRARDWLRSRANSIEGGTSEIQLNLIAKHGLGLYGDFA